MIRSYRYTVTIYLLPYKMKYSTADAGLFPRPVLRIGLCPVHRLPMLNTSMLSSTAMRYESGAKRLSSDSHTRDMHASRSSGTRYWSAAGCGGAAHHQRLVCSGGISVAR
jgi:hypothetical protein